MRATSASPATAETIRSELSDREIQVLKLIANGKDNAMIAGELHISPKTVKNHISNILMKLQIENRIQAAVYAVRSRDRLDRRRERRERAATAARASAARSVQVAVVALAAGERRELAASVAASPLRAHGRLARSAARAASRSPSSTSACA